MTGRRGFLAGALALGLFPRTTWAEAGSPAYLSAARRAEGDFVLCGLSATGEILFERPLPGRGHAAAAHPARAEAVAFARRPGRFAVVIDCARGTEIARLDAPAGRHFYGHGAFSADGRVLFTSENDYEAAQGMIGLWDAARGYARIGEFPSGGVGPHDIRLMPDGATLAVANGGIETHPDAGRAKLNIPLMRPNLSYLSLSGDLLEMVEIDPHLHRNSIRHLAVAPDGTVAFAMQWQGDTAETVPLLALHRRGDAPRLLSAPDPVQARMHGYAGSVAFCADGGEVAITSPRGGLCQVYDSATGAYAGLFEEPDVCGVAPGGDGFVLTAGSGRVTRVTPNGPRRGRAHDRQWDNHLVTVAPA